MRARQENIELVTFNSKKPTRNNDKINAYFMNKNVGFIRPKMIICGYTRKIFNRNIYITKDIRNVIFAFLQGILGDLVISKFEKITLKSTKLNRIYEYNSITINYGGVLTVNNWNPTNNEGGSLHLVCYGDILLKGMGNQIYNSMINLNGKGYKGGIPEYNGETYIGNSFKSTKSYHGGGAGGASKYIIKMNKEHNLNITELHAGGGGYQTNGYDHVFKCSTNKCGKSYGNRNVDVLHLGSGGGGEWKEYGINEYKAQNGGNGGGAIKIECYGNLILKGRSKIVCNGNGYNNVYPPGSGGSICITLNSIDNLKMDKLSCISALSGHCKNAMDYIEVDNVGAGRIKFIFLNKQNRYNLNQYKIFPKPIVV